MHDLVVTAKMVRRDHSLGIGFIRLSGGNSQLMRGMPADSVYESGNLGQRVVISRSAELVIVRMASLILLTST
jgi:hypothetical protein